MLVLLAILGGCGSPQVPPTPSPSPAPEPAVEADPTPTLRAGRWRAWLDSPGGELPFGLDLSEGGGRWQAWLINGEERIAVPASVVDGALTLELLPYDARITATFDPSGEQLTGEWVTARPGGAEARLPFHARWRRARRFSPLQVVGDPGRVAGRWAVRFESDPTPAVALFEQAEGGSEVTGTFLTATGDYRALAGSIEGDLLRLSAFDGAHAFLFHATLADQSLTGGFWSGDHWHETWTATPDPQASLPDPLTLTTATEVDWASLRFPDLDGRTRGLDDPEWATSPHLVQIMGSWCPNCNDQTELLVELHRRWSARGLQIVSLAFEHGEPERNRAAVQRYRDHHGAPWTWLVAGSSSKDQASAALPFLDRVRAYPTLLFVDRDGAIRAVDTGFVGPAARDEHLALRARYDAAIQALLEPG